MQRWVQFERLIKRTLLLSGLPAIPFLRDNLNPYGYTFKRLLLKELFVRYNCVTFVETGTYFGETAGWMARFAPNVLTCEPEETLFSINHKRFKDRSNIKLWNAGSEQCFTEMLKHVHGRALFWLDGHFSGGITALTSQHTPIIHELNCIKESGRIDDVVAIDDIRQFDTLQNRLSGSFESSYPSLDYSVDLLQKIANSNTISIIGDCLVSVPKVQI